MILRPVSDQKLACGKAWEQGGNAGTVNVDHFQYHEGSGDSSNIFTHTQNTITHNYVAKLYIGNRRQFTICLPFT